MGQDEEYLPVRREDEEQLLEGDSPQEYVLNSVQRHAQQNAWAMRFGVSAVLNVVLVFVAALAWAQSTSPTRTSQVAAGHEIYSESAYLRKRGPSNADEELLQHPHTRQ